MRTAASHYIDCMAVMPGHLYGALIEAGASESSAHKAEEELAGYDNRFAKVETDIAVMKWMLGFLIASVIGWFGIVIRLLVH